MNALTTPLAGAIIVEPQVFGDNRGWFFESYSRSKFLEIGIDFNVVQANRSFSARKGTLRGLHCQTAPMAQAKLITCVRGAIADYIVDIRQGSPSFMKWIKVELTAENKRMLFIPKGFLHGFLTLTDDVEVEYKVDEYYSPANDRSIRYDDMDIGILWEIQAPVLSAKDSSAPFLKDSDVCFKY